METKYLLDNKLSLPIAALILVLALCSCKSIQYVPAETVKTEQTTKYERDSIYIDRMVEKRGDTTYITRMEWRYKVKIDSFIKIDSIPVVVEIEVSKEINRLYWWQKALCYLGLLPLLYVIFKLLKRFYKPF